MRSSGPHALGAASAGAETPPGSPSAPRRAEGEPGDGDAGAWLLESVDTYVADTFLPQVGGARRGRDDAAVATPGPGRWGARGGERGGGSRGRRPELDAKAKRRRFATCAADADVG
jgi:hypothetical protein